MKGADSFCRTVCAPDLRIVSRSMASNCRRHCSDHWDNDPCRTRTHKGYAMTKSIMIVDDSAEILTLYRSILKRRGYSVLEALDGETALETLNDSTPDLFIVDVMMPAMNGIEL